MPEISFRTDLLSPSSSKTIEYSGSNPGQVFKLVPELMIDIFKVAPASVWEDQIKWDATSDPVEFYGEWRGKTPKDSFSIVWFKVEVSGSQNKERKGRVAIKIKGNLKTKFKSSTSIEKSLFVLYRYFRYRKQELKYIEEANKLIENFESAIRSHFDIMGRSY